MKLITKANYTLQKFPGKGGWTYAEIPEVKMDKNNPFGWVRVKGKIDNYDLDNYKLMPMGNGNVFLPVKALIRKKIKKEAGDTVLIELYIDTSTYQVPNEILECLSIESKKVNTFFNSLSDSEKQDYVNWIYNIKEEEKRVERIVSMINRLDQGLKFKD